MPPQMGFKKASEVKSYLRMALMGIPKSGKSYTALSIGTRLAELAGGRCAVIDTERGSASKLANVFDFDVLELYDDFSPDRYVEAISIALHEGYPVIVIDSLSQGWMGKNGALELVDKFTASAQAASKFTSGWSKVTPMQNRLVDAFMQAPAHVIATMRTKQAYVLDTDERGKQKPRKVGMEAVQRDGIEYEFDLVGQMVRVPEGRMLTIEQARFSEMDGVSFNNPDTRVADLLWEIVTHAKPEPPVGHWASDSVCQTVFANRAAEMRLSWAMLSRQLEPGKTLANLSDTSLSYEEALARLREIGGDD